MNVIELKKSNTLVCDDCDIVFNFDSSNIELDKVEVNGAQYLQPSVHCPNCGKAFRNIAEEYLPTAFKSGKSLNDYTFAEIAEISESGKAKEYFKKHDTKTFTMTDGKVYQAEIIGFNHDELADGSGTAGITFRLTRLLGEGDDSDRPMNENNTNEGGWRRCDLRKYLNGEFYDTALPDDLKAVIKEVKKYTANGGGKDSKVVASIDKVFILSEVEAFGTNKYSLPGEGKQYEGIQDYADRVMGYTNAVYSSLYFLRSPYQGYTHNFCAVGSTGYYNNDNAYGACGVSPCFAV